MKKLLRGARGELFTILLLLAAYLISETDYFKLQNDKNIAKPRNKLIDNKKYNPEEVFIKINKIENLEYLLIADYKHRDIIYELLPKDKWTLYKKFEDSDYKSTLLLFKKTN